MGMTIVVTEATPAGTETARMLLEDVPNPVTLRELIRHRVREEVARQNAASHRQQDWQEQATVALKSFQRNGFVVFVGDRQVTSLDEELTLTEADEVSFVRLVPLVGG